LAEKWKLAIFSGVSGTGPELPLKNPKDSSDIPVHLNAAGVLDIDYAVDRAKEALPPVHGRSSPAVKEANI
jgi:hypothetical protein